MTEASVRNLPLSSSIVASVSVSVILMGMLLVAGHQSYPGLHAVLDTGAFLLCGLLALLFFDVGTRLKLPLSLWLAIAFAVTSLLEFSHVVVSVEWAGILAPIARAASVLRPVTWSPTAYLLAIGIALAVLFARPGVVRAWGFAFALTAFAAGFLLLFYWLPLYTPPGWLRMTRPTLVLAPLLWAIAGGISWRRRDEDRILPLLTLMCAVLAPAHALMLYSQLPHDSVAMAAHVGKVCGYLVGLLALMRMASSDMLERIQADRELAELNKGLERRVIERTAQLETLNRNLQASEAQIRAMVDSALSAVVMMNHEGRILSWNKRAEEMFGWAKEAALGRDLADTIIPLRYRDAHRVGLKRFLDTLDGPVLNRLIEMPALHRSGREFPVELSIGVIKNGDTLSFCGFVTDITERLQAAAALQSSRNLLQAIIDHSAAVVYVKDPEGRYLLINRRFTEIFHLDRARILGKTDHDLFPREHADAFRAVDLQVLAAPAAMQMEEVVPQDDGIHTYLSVKCALRDAAETPYAMCGISTDITALKQGERKQRQQLGQLELLNRITHAIGERQDLPSILQVVLRSLEDDLPIDFACIGMHEVDAATIAVIGVGVKSRSLSLALRLPENAHIGIDQNGLSRCLGGQLVYEPDVQEVPHAFPQQLARGGLRAAVFAPLAVESRVFGVLVAARCVAASFTSSECEFLRQLGENVALAMNQAEVYGALQHAYDELHRSQQAILQQERLRALGQMASGIAHDINNAILPVALYTELLLEREPKLSDRGREQIATIQRAIDAVAKTVNSMREFSRPREPQGFIAQVDLNKIVTEVLDLARVRLTDLPHEQGIVIQLRTELSVAPPITQGAEHEIRDALTNLIFNAVDAMPNGGTLSIFTRSTSMKQGASFDQASVEVSDTGIGMDEETRRRCLEPYFTTKGERGTGLGLAMVYGMVQRHKAELEIESKPGHGTMVRLVFSSILPRTAPERSVAPPAPTDPARILLIDDDPIVLKALRDTLSGDGHHITTADGGRAGIEAFTAAQRGGEPFDAVITDLGMPSVDGRKVAAAVRAASATTPIILLTGWGQRLVDDNTVPLEINRILSKPPKIDELRRTLAELLTPAS